MNWLDFLILALIAWFTFSAYMSGFIRETVGLASVIAGVVLAGIFHGQVAESLDVVIDSETAREVVAFLAIFILVTLIGALAAYFLRRVTHLFFLGWADRSAGAVFGFIKAVVIIQAVTIIFVLQPALGMEEVIAGSTIGSFFLDTTPVVRALLPGEFDSALRDFTA